MTVYFMLRLDDEVTVLEKSMEEKGEKSSKSLLILPSGVAIQPPR